MRLPRFDGHRSGAKLRSGRAEVNQFPACHIAWGASCARESGTVYGGARKAVS
jgi:hypothetical protein